MVAVASLQTVSRVAEGSSMGHLSSLLILAILGLSVQGQTQGAVVGAAAGAKQSVLDPAQYPVCVCDSDCEDISNNKQEQYACFQYYCYPASTSASHPLRPCKKKSDCKRLSAKEGGDGSDGDCFRHHDRRQVNKGICVLSR